MNRNTGDVLTLQLDLTGVHAGPDLQVKGTQPLDDSRRASNRAGGSIERGEKAVPKCLNLSPAQPGNLLLIFSTLTCPSTRRLTLTGAKSMRLVSPHRRNRYTTPALVYPRQVVIRSIGVGEAGEFERAVAVGTGLAG